MTVTIARTLRADAIRDVCARPAVVAALEAGVPSTAARSRADRSRAVADGILRALEAADGDGRDQALLDEAADRLWEPVSPDLARILRASGVDGLYAYLVVEGAVRREAWRVDTARRRSIDVGPLDDAVAVPAERDPIDLTAFRRDVAAAAALTAARTGLPPDEAIRLVANEVSYVDAARAADRTPNGLWMALARLRPEWRGVAERGRAAGLGGGVLVEMAERSDRVVRRAIRWRLIGGLTAALLLAGAAGAIATAAWLEGTTPAARAEAPLEPSADPTASIARIAPIVSLIGRPAPAVVPRRTGQSKPSAGGESTPAATPGVADPARSTSSDMTCGLGSADLACR